MKIQPLIERFAATIKGYIDKRVGELDIRIKSLPVPKDGRDGIDGRNGMDAPPLEVICAEVRGRIPDPQDGKDGIDGKSVSIDDIRPLIDEAVKAIPTPKDGRDGVDGRSFTADEAKSMVDAAVTKAVQDAQQTWALDFERRAQDLFQRAYERMPIPKDGKDGRDAIDVEGFDMSLDGRDLTVSLKRGDAVIAIKSIRVPGFEDRGVYRDTEQYEKGDGVSFGGSFFIAQKDHPQGKPEQSRDWRLAIKKGRDGKDGRNGIDKTSSVKVP